MHLKKRKECLIGWLGLGLGWEGVGGWDGFGKKKVNLLRSIFVSLSYIALCLILVV